MALIRPQIVLPPGTGQSNNLASSTLTVAKPTGVKTGDLLVAALRCGSSTQTTDYQLSGWTRRGRAFEPSSATQRLTGLYTHYVSDASTEPESYTFTLQGNTFARQSGIIFVVRPGVGAEPWAGEPQFTNAQNFNGETTPYVVSFPAPSQSLQILAIGSELTSPHAVTLSAPGASLVGVHGSLSDQTNTGSTRSLIGAVSLVTQADTAAGPDIRLTLPAYAGSSADGFSISATEATSIPVAPESFSSVGQLLNTRGATVMHRAPTGYVESAKDTYERGYSTGFSAFEISLSFSADLVPFAHGHQYLDPQVLGTATQTMDPNQMTWASIQEEENIVGSNAPQPFYSLEDFLQDFVVSGRGVALVDPKWGFATQSKVDAMLDVCDAYGGPAKILIKFDSPTTNPVLRETARSRGYKTINYWGSNRVALAAQQQGWDILGGAYDAGPEMWSDIDSHGKPTWAAIVPSQAALDQAVENTEADFYVVRTLAVEPVGPTPAPVSSSWNGSSEEVVVLSLWDGSSELPVTLELVD